MQIAVSDSDIKEFMAVINRYHQEHPILVDKYLMGKEVEVDAFSACAQYLDPHLNQGLRQLNRSLPAKLDHSAMIDEWFIDKIAVLVEMEQKLKETKNLSRELLMEPIHCGQNSNQTQSPAQF